MNCSSTRHPDAADRGESESSFAAVAVISGRRAVAHSIRFASSTRNQCWPPARDAGADRYSEGLVASLDSPAGQSRAAPSQPLLRYIVCCTTYYTAVFYSTIHTVLYSVSLYTSFFKLFLYTIFPIGAGLEAATLPPEAIEKVKKTHSSSKSTGKSEDSTTGGNKPEAAAEPNKSEAFKVAFASLVLDVAREQLSGVVGLDALNDLRDLEPMIELMPGLVPILLRSSLLETRSPRRLQQQRADSASDAAGAERGLSRLPRARPPPRSSEEHLRKQVAARVAGLLENFASIATNTSASTGRSSSVSVSLHSLSLSSSLNSPGGKNFIRALLASQQQARAADMALGPASGAEPVPQQVHLSRKFLTLCSTAMSSSSAASRKRDVVDFILLRFVLIFSRLNSMSVRIRTGILILLVLIYLCSRELQDTSVHS